jgi:hypothetical protein
MTRLTGTMIFMCLSSLYGPLAESNGEGMLA